MRRRLKNQKGISLVELAVLIPLLLILITGTIDYGITIRTVKRLSFAAKTGARYAASQSAGGAYACGADINGRSCAAAIGGGAPSITHFAQWAACRSLQEADLIGDDWEVLVEILSATGIVEDSLANPSGQVVRVTAQRRPDADRFCIVCLDEVMGTEIQGPENNAVMSVSSFALEGRC